MLTPCPCHKAHWRLCSPRLTQLTLGYLTTTYVCSGNLLENTQLVASLNATKAGASTIIASLASSADLAQALEAQRGAYRPLAATAAQLYLLLPDLAALNPMARFSLAAFLLLFKQALAQGGNGCSGGSVAQRIAALSSAFVGVSMRVTARTQAPTALGLLAATTHFHTARLGTHPTTATPLPCTAPQLLYNHGSRALFNSDRLAFGLHLARQLHPDSMPTEEWSFLLTRLAGGTAAVAGMPQQGQAAAMRAPAWLPEDQAAGLTAMEQALPELAAQADLRNAAVWAAWGAGPDASAGLGAPPSVAGRLSAFQQLLLVKALCPDRYILRACCCLAQPQQRCGWHYGSMVQCAFQDSLR